MVTGRAHAAISTLLFFFLASSATLHAQLFLEKDYEDENAHKEHMTRADTAIVTPDDSLIRDLLDYADRHVGKRYRNGASGPQAFDCSGFTSFVFNRFGYNLPRSSAQQSFVGEPVAPGDWQPGDLVFFNGYRAGGTRVGHVGIVTRNNGDSTFHFIHASTSQGVRYDRSDDRYYDIRYVAARRLIGSNPTNAVANDDRLEKTITNRPTRYETSMTQTTYDVRKGDNLYSIARRNGCSVRDLKEWNGLKGSHLAIGQSLIIKKTQRQAVTTRTDDINDNDKNDTYDNNDKENQETPRYHTVEKGETLFSISVHYSVPVSDIRRFNQLNDNTIKIGQRLLLTPPDTTDDTQPTEP